MTYILILGYLPMLFSQATINLTEKSLPLKINDAVQVYHTAEKHSPEEIHQLILNQQLSVSGRQTSQGFSSNYFWIHFQLLSSSAREQPIILEIANPHLDKVLLYKKQQSGEYYLSGMAGDRMKFHERSIYNKNILFDISLSEKEAEEYLIMVEKKNSAVSFPLKLWDKKAYHLHSSRTDIAYGLFFGILGLVWVFGLIVGIIMKQKTILSYGFYVFFSMFYFFTQLGYSFQFLYPNSSLINNYTRPILLAAAIISYGIFATNLLNSKTHFPKATSLIKYTNYLLASLVFLWIFTFRPFPFTTVIVVNFIYIYIVMIGLLSLWMAVQSLNRFPSESRIYLISFSAIFIGAMLSLAPEYGLLPENHFPIPTSMIGTGIEIFILAFFLLVQVKKMALSNKSLKQNHELLRQRYQKSIRNNSIPKQVVEPISTIHLKSKAVIQVAEIISISSDGHYIEYSLHGKSKPEIDRNTLKSIKELLPDHQFMQIHRSHIINLRYVRAVFSQEVLLQNGAKLPLSRTFKSNLQSALEKT